MPFRCNTYSLCAPDVLTHQLAISWPPGAAHQPGPPPAPGAAATAQAAGNDGDCMGPRIAVVGHWRRGAAAARQCWRGSFDRRSAECRKYEAPEHWWRVLEAGLDPLTITCKLIELAEPLWIAAVVVLGCRLWWPRPSPGHPKSPPMQTLSPCQRNSSSEQPYCDGRLSGTDSALDCRVTQLDLRIRDLELKKNGRAAAQR